MVYSKCVRETLYTTFSVTEKKSIQLYLYYTFKQMLLCISVRNEHKYDYRYMLTFKASFDENPMFEFF